VTAPLPDGQLIETSLINILYFQSVMAPRRCEWSLLHLGKQLVDVPGR
jgi:hypothetical protein